MKTGLFGLAVSLSLLLWQAGYAQASVLFYDDGVRDYNSGRYTSAALALTKAAKLDPLNPMVHYYLANSLVRVKDHKRAIQEYRLSYVLEPTSLVADYCRQALTKYKQPIPSSQEAAIVRNTMGGASSVNVVASASSASPHLQRSLNAIRRQLELEKSKDQNISDSTASDILERARSRAREVDMRAQTEIERLYMPQPRQAPVSAELLAMREQAIRSSAKDEQDAILREADTRADRYRKVGEMRQSALDQVAANLETQMYQNGANSGVRLIPEGTDLYVRRYASVPTSRVIPAARPAVVRIYGYSPSNAEVSQSEAEAPGTEAGFAVVRGQVLK